MAGRAANSLETILTYENRDLSQWSEQWSTSHIPGMDDASGRPRRRALGRRRLRIGSLVLGVLLTMHCRVAASALTGGLIVFLMFLILAVSLLANPMRHFEVYLGQWSISGPGRAFRIIPMLDGIGVAICINAIVRAINCCFIAAIALVYVSHSVSDAELPFTYCRDFNLKPYKPIVKEMARVMMVESRFSMEAGVPDYTDYSNTTMSAVTVGLHENAWRDFRFSNRSVLREGLAPKLKPHQIAICNENYTGSYPVLFDTPAYNYFYVELAHLRGDHDLGHFNLTLLMYNIVVWCVIWLLMVAERFRYGKLIWNNVFMWLVIIPLIWAVVLFVGAISDLVILKKSIKRVFKMGAKEILAAVADALEVALYIHAAGVGTEFVHGKGLNHYASGHIDPSFHAENAWHSVLLVFVACLHCIAAALCALVDSTHVNSASMAESTLWIMPMYSKCTSLGHYSHLLSTLVFGGLVFSYMAVAFILLKTALHIIFEYKVKLVFVEQLVVGALIVTCIGLSLPFASNGGLALLESVDAFMTGLAITFICFMELIGMLYVYRAHDFVSDMDVSMEESVCSSRIHWQWKMLPFVTLITLFLKGLTLAQAELPSTSLYIAIAPLAAVLIAIPLRALHNAFVFMRPSPRRGT